MTKREKRSNRHQTPIDYFSDFFEWPQNWMVENKDIAIGNNLLETFIPFIDSLIREGLAVRTIRNHMLNLSVLGGEIIRRLNDGDEHNRKLKSGKLLLEYIDDEQGPLVHHWDINDRADEACLKSFDGTCRKLYTFITAAN